MTKQDLFLAAKKTRENAYAPYSKFQVGAACSLEGSEEIFTGCNVENSSYGATLCAERNSIFQAVAKVGGKIKPKELVLVTDSDPIAFPCAFCLQILSEFCTADFPIHIANLEGIQKSLQLKDLLPQPFSADSLPSS